MSGAEERTKHPEGKGFEKFFTKLLVENLGAFRGSCFERDVIRELKEEMWAVYKRRAIECDNRTGDYAPRTI